jgi:hypothetical protein
MSFGVTATMTRTATSGQRNAIFAKRLAGNLHHVETAAPFAHRVFAAGHGWFGFHF